MRYARAVTRFVLDYVKLGFTDSAFPDLFNAVWIAALVLLVVQVVGYNVLIRRYHRYPPLLALQEWMLWTGITFFGLLLVAALFHFSFVFLLAIIAGGLGFYAWARFVHWPPLIEAYNEQLRRQRFFSQAKYKHPEATVRSKRRRRGR
jgi:Na+/citrate or Na+/malate symporter